MPQHETKKCTRCSSCFECKTGSILLCQCSQIEMSAEQLEYANTQYQDCLCLSCLEEVRSEYNQLSYDKNMQKLISGRGQLKK